LWERRPRREKQTTNIRPEGGAPTQRANIRPEGGAPTQEKGFAAGTPRLQKTGSALCHQGGNVAKVSKMVWGMRSSMTVLSTTPSSTAARGMP
jgi:hypothetical protein